MSEVDTLLKICSRCKKHLTIEHYNIKKDNVYLTSCKLCCEYGRLRKLEHREEVKEKSRLIYKTDSTVSENKKIYNESHKEHITIIRCERVKCQECGKEMQKSSKLKHIRFHCHSSLL